MIFHFPFCVRIYNSFKSIERNKRVNWSNLNSRRSMKNAIFNVFVNGRLRESFTASVPKRKLRVNYLIAVWKNVELILCCVGMRRPVASINRKIYVKFKSRFNRNFSWNFESLFAVFRLSIYHQFKRPIIDTKSFSICHFWFERIILFEE